MNQKTPDESRKTEKQQTQADRFREDDALRDAFEIVDVVKEICPNTIIKPEEFRKRYEALREPPDPPDSNQAGAVEDG